MGTPKVQPRPTNYHQYYKPRTETTWLENSNIMFEIPDLLWEGWRNGEALQLFTSVIDKAKEISKTEGLSDLQKVCLSQCISSRILRADPDAKVSFFNLGQLFESVPSTIEKGETSCRGYARVFLKVATLLGLDSRLLASTNHIFNEVKTAAGTVRLDPRDTTCYLWR